MKIKPEEVKKILDRIEERARGGWMSGRLPEEILADWFNELFDKEPEKSEEFDGKGAYP